MTPRLGFLTHVTSGRTSAESLHIALDLFQAADELGYDTGWVAQHRFGDPDGALPAPLVFLAAAASRTHRIGLGTAVAVLPTEDPIALAEQALVVDGLSQGRLQLGVGTGGHPQTFAATGADLARKYADYASKLTTLTDALGGRPINNSSATLDPAAAPIANRIWESTTSTAGGARIGRQGNGLLLARSVYFAEQATDQHQEPVVRSYRDAITVRTPRIGVSRTVYPATDRRASTADLTDGITAYAAQMVAEGHFAAGLSPEEYFARSFIHHGSAEDVVESLVADRILASATDLIIQTSPGTVHPDKTLAAMEVIAHSVMPELRRRLALPIEASAVYR
ncbi:LLM class flavin-dependent oxidoreductase [Mycobacterium sp. NPDC003449]